MNVKQILCPVDFSGTSEKALEVASEFARDTQAVLHIVHVEYSGNPEMTSNEVSKKLEDTSFFLTTPAGTAVTFSQHLLKGDPEQVIAEFIREHDIDVVVVGSHGQGKRTDAAIGSFAESMMRESPVPVLVVREDMERVRPMSRPASISKTD